MNYLQAFLIGSSAPIVLPFFATVGRYPREKLRFRYRDYTLMAPLYLGLMNATGKYLSHRMGLGVVGRIVLTTLMSAGIVGSVITCLPAYTFTEREQWYLQYMGLLRAHAVVHTLAVALDTWVTAAK